MTPDRAEEAKRKLAYASSLPLPTGARCGFCTKPITDEDAPAGFCSMGCMQEKGGDVSQAKLRELVFARDGGKCAGLLRDGRRCAVDCVKLRERIEAFKKRAESAGVGILTEDFIDRGAYSSLLHQLALLGFDRDAIVSGASLWEADHVNPRVKGGPTTLENARTLCIPCHNAATSGLNAERADKRRRGRFGR